MNIADNLERTARFFPDQIAVIDEDREIPFRQFNADSSRMAASLAGAGVEAGDQVVLCAPNSYEWLATYYGVIKAGAVALTISHLTPADEMNRMLTDCRPKAVLAGDEKVGDVQFLKESGDAYLVISRRGDVSCDELIKGGHPNFKTVDRNRHDPCAVLFAGGTTGIPKGAMLSHENIQASVFNVAHFERSSQADRALCFLPLNHVFAQIHIMQSMVYCGGGLVLHPGFDLERTLASMERHRVTNLYAVPTVYIRMLELNNLRERIPSIRYCFSAAASMAAEIVREWKDRTGLDIHEAYGMTESASMVTYNHFYRHVKGSVGTPVNLVEIQIRDQDGNVVKAGDEVEELLYAHPDVMECAVVGLPDQEYGERVTAFIVTPARGKQDPDNLRRFLKQRLTGFKVPKAFIFVEDLPKNNAGKLLKRKIRDQYTD